MYSLNCALCSETSDSVFQNGVLCQKPFQHVFETRLFFLCHMQDFASALKGGMLTVIPLLRSYNLLYIKSLVGHYHISFLQQLYQP